MWRKLAQWQPDVRAENAQEFWAEWFQWLVARLLNSAQAGSQSPAHEAFSDWRPTP